MIERVSDVKCVCVFLPTYPRQELDKDMKNKKSLIACIFHLDIISCTFKKHSPSDIFDT